MRKFAVMILAGVSTVAVAAPTIAQAQNRRDLSSEIVVTARRSNESAQDVPVSIVPISGQTIKDLAITRAEELSKLAPGLTITPPTTSQSDQAIIMRGVRWSPSSGAAAVPIYLNELPFSPNTGLFSMFDVGQIEVLHGPQGTSRGAPSISGAITIATRRPDLTDIGGYVQGMVATHDHQNVQGAISFPIIPDMLAVRVAGNFERSEANTVRSIFLSKQPEVKDRLFRVSALFQPTDTVELFAMYQNRHYDGTFFSAVAGTGSLGNPARGIPAHFNGPTLAVDQYASVSEISNDSTASSQQVTVNAKWDVFGQTLSYNFGRDWGHSDGGGSQDVGNILTGYDVANSTQQRLKTTIHEVRLSSQRGQHLFDYDVGYFRNTSSSIITNTAPNFLPGAFGFFPGQVTTPVPAYILTSVAPITIREKDESVYGNVQLHLPYDIEVTGGIRHIKSSQPVTAQLTLSAGAFPFPKPAALGSLSCTFAGFANSVFPGFCDFPIPASVGAPVFYPNKHSATIYNASVSKKFGDNILLYGTVGSSFRQGLAAILNTGLPLNLINPAPEKSTSYEIGFKSTLAPNVHFNIAVFQIDYKGQLANFPGIRYFSSTSLSTATTNQSFFRNVDSRVRGFEAEFYAKPFPDFSINANVSYAKMESRGGLVPANPGDCAAATAVSAANPINFCPTTRGQDITPSPYFQANLMGSYQHELTGNIDGYLRFNVNYQGKSKNYGISRRPSSAFALVDLFAGLTDDHVGWDVGLFSKNLFNVKHELTRRALAPDAIYGDLGYDLVTATQPREFGVQLRYTFGSH